MSVRSPQAVLWDHVLHILRTRISPDAYQRWFSSLVLSEANESTVSLLVPDGIHQLWIEMNYQTTLQDAFQSITGVRPAFQFLLNPDPLPVQEEELPAPPSAVAVEKEARGFSLSNEPAPAAAAASMEPLTGPGLPGIDDDRLPREGLSPGRTFESFVVGANNEFAHAAAMAVAQRPGRAYNPLFLYGGTGLGKTHLMQAIGAHIQRTRPKARVVYITSEEFTNQFIIALQENSLVKFRRRFRQADVLLIDDVQFLAGKERSQEEFFHTFNALFDGNKQLVLSSDCPPAEMRQLESRLVSRCEWGLTAELTPPDQETRVAILRKRAESLRVDIPSHIIDFIAARIHSNVRRLHGALFRVASWTSLHGTISAEKAGDLLRDVLQEEARKSITIDRIQRAVAETYDIRLADMTSRKRPANIALARQVAMYLARDLTGSSYQEIGDAFGGRDHGTIMHACRAIERRMKEDEPFRLRVEALTTTMRRQG